MTDERKIQLLEDGFRALAKAVKSESKAGNWQYQEALIDIDAVVAELRRDAEEAKR